jgi:formate dehydrogenase subunit delta
MSPDKMIRMANQIALFMTSRPADKAAEGVALHISDYWEPRMRNQLFDHVAAGGAGLHPLVLKAAPAIRRPLEMT